MWGGAQDNDERHEGKREESSSSLAAIVSCWSIFRKMPSPLVIEPIIHSRADGTSSGETDDDETGSPYKKERKGPCLSSCAPAGCCISTNELVRKWHYPFC